MKKTATKSRQRALAELRACGISIKQWARDHGFRYQVAKDVLYGRVQGLRGESHTVAVALGIKPDPRDLGIDPGQFRRSAA